MAPDSQPDPRLHALMEWLDSAPVDVHEWSGFATALEASFDSTGTARAPDDNAAPPAAHQGPRASRKALLPRLQEALRLRRDSATIQLEQHALLQALDRLGTAAFTLDPQARLLHANNRAEACFHGGFGLSLRCGQVLADDPSLAPRWRRLVQQAGISGGGGAMAFPRAGRIPATALVAPMRGSKQEPSTLVLLRDPRVQAPCCALLCQLFDLTRTEAAVAGALAEGLTLERIAQRMRIGIGTVRSHLKQVLTKTGTRRQAQLVALVVGSVAMFSGVLTDTDGAESSSPSRLGEAPILRNGETARAQPSQPIIEDASCLPSQES